MKRLIPASILLLLLSAAAFGTPITDLVFTLSPSIEFYPPGALPSFCETFGTSPACVVFSGTLTDTDADNSVDQQVISLDNISIDFSPDPIAASYFSIDATFFSLPALKS